MPDLVYTPGIRVIVDSAVKGLIDVSEDIEDASVRLSENNLHSVNLTLANPRGKYNGVFAPNDRITVQLKRIKWLQIFAGYTNTVPYFSAYQGSISITADCTLKSLKYFPWDARSMKAQQFINMRNREGANESDGGLASAITNILTEVARWPAEKVHIGGMPQGWVSKVKSVFDQIDLASSRIEDALGPNPFLGNGGIIGGIGAVPLPSSGAGKAVAAAYTQLGVPYVYAAEEPGVAFDCSGLTKWAWKQAGVDLPHQSEEQYNTLPHIAQSQVLPGDLLFYKQPISHVAIYVGDDKLIHAPAPGKFVELRDVVWNDVVGIARPGNPDSVTNSNNSTNNVYYPIPAGRSEIYAFESGWGGYTINQIPTSAMTNTTTTGYGHPVAVKSFNEMVAAAKLEGYDFSCQMYRSTDSDSDLHGWGIAADIRVLRPTNPTDGTNTKYPTYNAEQMYGTPEYAWLAQNAYRWGWAQPSLRQYGGTVSSPWHWEFWAFPEFKDGKASSPGTTGYNPFDNSRLRDQMPINPAANLFGAINFWMMNTGYDEESDTLTGERALMNDVPIITTVQQLVKAAGRSFCSAPNGDFIAWFPDYWNEYGTTGRLDVELVEVINFSVQWSDEPLITHQYVEGSIDVASLGPLPGGTINTTSALSTRGVVTVNTPDLLKIIANISDTRNPYRWLQDPSLLLSRFGARIDRKQVSILTTPQEEFWYAINEFTSAWASQFSCSLQTTFLPEAFPGMILRIPEYGVQFYITGVSHHVDLRGESGFTTSVSIVAPSAIEGSGFFLFPISEEYNDAPSRGGTGPLKYR